MPTQLIMVEGVPFTGKSTLSEFVAQQLGLNSVASLWLAEGTMLQRYFPHILATFEGEQPVSEELLRADWRGFVRAVADTEATFVVDSALSYAALHPLLAEDRPTDALLAELRHVHAMCAPLQPRVLHLSGDIATLVPASIAERGHEWQEHLVGQSDAAPYQRARGRSGVAGAIEFLSDTQALMHRVLVDGGWQAMTLDVSATDWSVNRRAVLDYLGLAEVRVARPSLDQAALAALTGTYQAEQAEDTPQTLSVRLEQGGLALHGPHMRYGALVALGDARFHLQATQVDVEFVVQDGPAQRLVLLRADGKRQVYRRT